ncbi:MAG: peptidase dimerization domain-containing protein [Tannerellaceae bacterium]|nr:peptidase dimerization domain-containing protein [Tannerellaceae bacterium]
MKSETTLFCCMKSETTLFWIRLTTTGKASHGSSPQDGVNAVSHMVYYLDKYKEEIATSENFSSSVNTVTGGTATNIVPDKCVAEIQFTSDGTVTPDEVVQQMQALSETVAQELEEFQLEIELVN